MRIQFKETVWFEVEVEETSIDVTLLKKELKQQHIKTAVDLVDYLSSEGGELCKTEYLLDTGVTMVPSENDGWATIELYNDRNQLIYANGKH